MGYIPLSNTVYSPGPGESLLTAGVFLAACGMVLQGATTLWTILRLRAPGITMMRLPVFVWTQLVTCLMVAAAFPALLAAMAVVALDRADPALFSSNTWNIAYENLFWFYGHPVVYVMFFPFVGCVAGRSGPRSPSAPKPGGAVASRRLTGALVRGRLDDARRHCRDALALRTANGSSRARGMRTAGGPRRRLAGQCLADPVGRQGSHVTAIRWSMLARPYPRPKRLTDGKITWSRPL